jgi:hypothetical protein
MKLHKIPVNEPLCYNHQWAGSFGGGRLNKELRIQTEDNEVTFIVLQDHQVQYRGPSRPDAVSIYNALP